MGPDHKCNFAHGFHDKQKRSYDRPRRYDDSPSLQIVVESGAEEIDRNMNGSPVGVEDLVRKFSVTSIKEKCNNRWRRRKDNHKEEEEKVVGEDLV